MDRHRDYFEWAFMNELPVSSCQGREIDEKFRVTSAGDRFRMYATWGRVETSGSCGRPVSSTDGRESFEEYIGLACDKDTDRLVGITEFIMYPIRRS